MGEVHPRDRVWGFQPLGALNPVLAVAVSKGGGLGFLELRGTDEVVRAAIARCRRTLGEAFGVRVPEACAFGPEILDAPQRPSAPAPSSVPVPVPVLGSAGVVRADDRDGARVDVIVLAGGPDADGVAVARWRPAAHRIAVEVVSLDEARAAAAAGADALVLSGAEAGGRVGETGAFVLLQQVVADLDLPVWVRGGMGVHGAAAAVAGGARGVVLDAQLTLVKEGVPSSTDEVRAAIGAMDGSETRLLAGYRVYVRPGTLAARLPEDADRASVLAHLGADDLEGGLVAVGQDGALAAGLARRFGTAGRLVHALQLGIDEHVASALATRPLAPGSRLAASLGVEYPVAQGPMTRVSDRAAFARAVAHGGGVPFLALALMSGGEARALLDETAELLGDLPWGVGILGFVPPEVREQQLEVVHDVRPSVAIIAGGRPSQAAPLEAVGIRTFLHVPSPGLLARFLKDGARRFVFEGSECGGHVGPRTSFLLWEQQIAELEAFAASGGTDARGSLEGVEVLFAGGIHDDRSGAVVATMAAPLADRGAAVGTLMGTAYLFCEEAVASGAILPAYQEVALGCTGTVLLETSPGHATRCVETGYVEAFRAAKERLTGKGVPPQEMWTELEQMNLGRLRLASKGLAYGEEGLTAADTDRQRAEGMYMIGDVATMRHGRTTVEQLHREVTEGSAAFLTRRAGTLGVGTLTGVREPPRPVDVAIVGMACTFPGATSTEEFWSNVVGGVDSVREVPAERWDPAVYFDEEARPELAGVKSPSKWGGFLPPVPFDALAYGIPPASLGSIEPVQLLALEMAARALADAGYASREFDRRRVSVVFGAEAGTDLANAYGLRSVLPSFIPGIPPSLDDFLPKLTEDSFPGLLANVIAGRIANRLDLGGMNCTVDAACASSLAALDVACKDLVTGNADMVLCGGADLHNGIHEYLLFGSVHALSPTGRCRSFAADADGMTLGEGVACLVLKRLEDAVRDGDRVYAVVKAIAGSSDGRHLGLTAPRAEGQQLALDRAYGRAGVSPAEVGLIEAHGTGTVVGDRTELATLTGVFAGNGAPPAHCTIGSVKSNIGHTKCAAGVAGIVKAAQAIWRGVRPPTLHVTAPNPAYDEQTSPFRFESRALPWVSDRRVAGVSSFGFGGANFHVVLSSHEEEPLPAHGVDVWPAELFLVRGATLAAAGERIGAIEEHLAAAASVGADIRLRDLAAAVSRGGSGPVQVAVVAADAADLMEKLAWAREASPGASRSDGAYVAAHESASGRLGAGPGAVAFCFPGQGSQRPGMLGDLFVTFPSLRRHLDLAPDWRDVLLPPAAFTSEARAAQKQAITDTRAAQPTLGIAGMAMSDLLGQAGVHPDMAGGHSYGELVALATAGVIGEGDLLALSRVRAEAILDAAQGDPGTMAAVVADAAAVEEELRSLGLADVVVANRNSPEQTVISGPTGSVERALAGLADRRIRAKRIAVACAFHSPVTAGAGDALASWLDGIEIRSPAFPVWSNTLAAPYPLDPGDIRRLLARQVASPVLWTEQVEAMYAVGARVFVESGPGRVLGQLIGRILGDRPHVTVACDVSGEPGIGRFLRALAELAVHGVAVDPEVLFRGRATPVQLASPPQAPPAWTVNGHLVRTRDGQVVRGGLRPMNEAPQLGPAFDAALPSGLPPAAEREEVVRQYLATMRETVSAQREIMLRYLGAHPTDAPVAGASSGSAAVAPQPALFEPPAFPETAAGAGPDAAAPTPQEVPALGAEDLLAAVIAVVAERTGYPTDMLDPDQDLEADLSIDSIKRIEILGELADRVGLPVASDGSVEESAIEELARLKTLRGIVSWIVAARSADAESGAEGAAGTGTDARAEDGGGERLSAAPPAPGSVRCPVRLEELPLPGEPDLGVLRGRRFAIIDDGRGVALHLATLFEAHDARSFLVAPGVSPTLGGSEPLDGLVDLSALAPDAATTALTSYPAVRDAALAGARWILAASASGGRFGRPARGADAGAAGGNGGRPGPGGVGLAAGAGLPGMCRSLARELPDVSVRSVDLDVKEEASVLASAVLSELLDTAAPVAVGRVGGRRYGLVVTPSGPESAAPAPPVLGAASVVVLTGGARGVTAKIARSIARTAHCHVVLLGRTQRREGPEDPATAAATDEAGLRRALVAAGERDTRRVEVRVRRIMAEREVARTLSETGEDAASVTYLQVDVRDAGALRQGLDAVWDRFGRVDLVVHGAGVLDDKLLVDKPPESFASVFGTKVAGGVALTAWLADRPDGAPPATIVFMGSISGVFGNRGQADYAAANDALDTLAAALEGAPGLRALAVDWGPWAGGGMVSPELEREYERRGIGLLDPEDAVGRLLDELATPRSGDAQIVVMRGDPGAIAAGNR